MASQLNTVTIKFMVQHPWSEASFTIDDDSVTMQLPDPSDNTLASLMYYLARIPGCMSGTIAQQTIRIQFLEISTDTRLQTMVTAGSVISTFTGQGVMFAVFE